MPYSAYKLHSEQAALRKNGLTESKPPDLNRSAGMDAGESWEIHSWIQSCSCVGYLAEIQSW